MLTRQIREEISFGEWIKSRRHALDLTQKEVAECVGCSVVTVRKIEANERQSSKSMALRLAECLEIATEDQTAFVAFARGSNTPPTIAAPESIIHKALRWLSTHLEPNSVDPAQLYPRDSTPERITEPPPKFQSRLRPTEPIQMARSDEDVINTGLKQRNRARMLEKMQQFWIDGALRGSLYERVSHELSFVYKSEAIDHPLVATIGQHQLANQMLLAGTNVTEVFDNSDGKLLILGEPGSGKTVSLLEITRLLIARCQADDTHPIPVVFNLSSWDAKQQLFENWLIDELHNKYQVSRMVASQWVKSSSLALLLDGLDEIDTSHREAAVRAINTFLSDHGLLLQMVICSRTADYDMLMLRLRLQSAIVLQPLTMEQINAYLEHFRDTAPSMRDLLRRDPGLLEVISNPLMLNIMLMVCQDIDPQDAVFADSVETWRRTLFEAYLRRMWARHGASLPYSWVQIKHYLSWMAHQMTQHRQSILLIERLQPSWLPAAQQESFQRQVRLVFLCLSTIVWGTAYFFAGDVLGAPAWLFAVGMAGSNLVPAWIFTGEGWKAQPKRLLAGLALGVGLACVLTVGVGVVAGLVSLFVYAIPMVMTFQTGADFMTRTGNTPRYIAQIETLRFSLDKASMRAGLLGGLVTGALNVIGAWLIWGHADVSVLDIGLAIAVGSIFPAIAFFVWSGLTSSSVEKHAWPNEGTWNSLRNGLRVWLLFALITLPLGLLGIGPVSSTSIGLAIEGAAWIAVGSWLFFFYGGYSVIQHALLRFSLWRTGSIPGNCTQFLDCAARLTFLRKVGGGYIFFHRLLLDYFAALSSTGTTGM